MFCLFIIIYAAIYTYNEMLWISITIKSLFLLIDLFSLDSNLNLLSFSDKRKLLFIMQNLFIWVWYCIPNSVRKNIHKMRLCAKEQRTIAGIYLGLTKVYKTYVSSGVHYRFKLLLGTLLWNLRLYKIMFYA